MMEDRRVGDEGRMRRWSEVEGAGLVKPEFDPRGWPVLGCDERLIGEIEELIVDVVAHRICYGAIRMRLWDEWLETRPFRLLPVGLLRLDADEGRAFLARFELDDVIGFPAYDGGEIKVELEEALRQVFIGDDERIYTHEDLRLRREGRIDSRI